MLGSTADGLFWMYRQLERTEYNTRLLDTGLRIALTRAVTVSDAWESVLRTAGMAEAYEASYGVPDAASVIDFTLRNRDNPASVLSLAESIRSNARRVRTALTREVWEATNDCVATVRRELEEPVAPRDLPAVLATIRKETEYVHGATHATMLRNDRFNFASLGTFVERANNTARLLDVKYYVLLPTPGHVGSVFDKLQWESILRSVSALRAFRWAKSEELTAAGVADFLILDERMPRSLHFCARKIHENLGELAREYECTVEAHALGDKLLARYTKRDINEIFAEGLHEFLRTAVADTNALGSQISRDYRFTE